MASGQSENTNYEEEDIPFNTISTRSGFLSVSGNSISNIDTDFISVSGNTISTLDSDFLSLCDGNSSTRTLDRALSQCSVESTETPYNDQETELASTNSLDHASTSQEDPEVRSNFLSTVNNMSMQLNEDVLVHTHQMCSHCISDRQRLKATHLCKSCPCDCRYICHMCLQSHNFNHAVVSLSGVDHSQLKKDTKAEVTGLKTLNNEASDTEDSAYDLQADNSTDSSDVNAETFEDDEENEEMHRQKSNIENQQEMGILKSMHGTEVRTPGSKEKVRPRFYKDSLYTEITKETRYTNPSLLPTGKFRKYGTYSINEQSDTKRCIITGICELESGKVVLVDAENCSLKVLKADTFEMVSSHKVDGNPMYICLIEKEKVAVAFVEPKIKIVIIAKDLCITNSFDLDKSCTNLTYGKPNLYLCLPDRLESYNENGEQKYSLRLASSRMGTKFVNLNKITINKDEDTLYIVDQDSGIVVTDTSGHVQRIISENINKPDAICIDESGCLFVTEVHSNRVLNISDDGKVEHVLEEVSKDEHPISLCHGRVGNRLIVGIWCSDNIHVFTC